MNILGLVTSALAASPHSSCGPSSLLLVNTIERPGPAGVAYTWGGGRAARGRCVARGAEAARALAAQ